MAAKQGKNGRPILPQDATELDAYTPSGRVFYKKK